MPAKTARHHKITIRQPASLKRKVEQAAARRGMTVTSFINSTLEGAAERVLRRVRRRELSERDQGALLDLLAHPKGPNASLLRAALRYRDRYGG